MNKIKTTKKEMKENYRIASVGYCEAQHLLNYKSPAAYSTRVEGWACDYYDIDGVIISTGYSPLDNKNVVCEHKTVRKYDDLAIGKTREEIDVLLRQFIKEIAG